MMRTVLLGSLLSAALGVGMGTAFWSDISVATMAKAPQLELAPAATWSEGPAIEPGYSAVADLRPAQLTPAALQTWSWSEPQPVSAPPASLSDQPWDEIRPEELVEPASAPEPDAAGSEPALDLAPVPAEALAPEPVTYAALP